MVARIDKLTKEQSDAMSAWADRWIEIELKRQERDCNDCTSPYVRLDHNPYITGGLTVDGHNIGVCVPRTGVVDALP